MLCALFFFFFPSFLFIVLYVGLIRELEVLNFLSGLNLRLSDRNVMTHCYVLDIANLSVYLMERSCLFVLVLIYLKFLFH